jgi:DNA-binding Lrp family transcriptional regulator/NAD(P)H-dependent FMN reductase
MSTILAICGSLNDGSSNARLLDLVRSLAPDGVDVVRSTSVEALPHFRPDVEAPDGGPVARFRAEIGTADAVLIATPEYAHALPGALKDALDWLVGSGELYGKRVGVLSAAPAPERGTNAREMLERTLRAQGAEVLVNETVVERDVDPAALVRVLDVLSGERSAGSAACARPRPRPGGAGPPAGTSGEIGQVRRRVVACSPMANPPELDDVDRRILAALHRDGRLSTRALGVEVGMSAGAVAERVRRLEAGGAIRGYGADVDPAAVGYGMRVLVGLQIEQGGPPLQHTVDALLAVDEVAEVSIVSGQWDLIVFLQVRDQHHLRELVSERLWGVPGFRHSETMLVLDAYDGGAAWLR